MFLRKSSAIQNPTLQNQDPESKLIIPNSKMQRYLKEKLFETNCCIFGYPWVPTIHGQL